ncbi:MAG: chemotaxis protein CheW [Euryarchaeota archaeon]|nr:chemotaxis protein CheW [Euryarchaeota archaeon]
MQEDELKLVVFRLGDEEYAAEVSQVREIIRMEKITRLPRAPEFVEGIINLRGQLTTVISLRRLFGLPEEQMPGRRIIVLDQEEPTGIVVDSVTEVLSLSREEVDTPEHVFGADTRFIKGVGKREDRLIIILDLSRVLKPEEVEGLQEVRELVAQEVRE